MLRSLASAAARSSQARRAVLGAPALARPQMVKAVVRPVLQLPLRAQFSTGTFLPLPEVTDRVINVVKAFEKVDGAKVNDSAHFINDLGLDSLDAVEVVMAIEEEFVIEIPDDVAEKLTSVADAIKFISEHPQAK